MRAVLFAFLVGAFVSSLDIRGDDASRSSPALAALVETERAFARAAVQKGMRDAFLEYFADDAIAFTPDPVSARDRLRTRPSRPFSEVELTWEPRTGDVAAAGDLGWLTGPSTYVNHLEGAGQPRHGNYLSIWKKQSTGEWRVYIDVGCALPQPAPFAPGFVPLALGERWTSADDRASARDALVAADRALNAAISRDGAARAYAERLAAGSRLHRQGRMPLAGSRAIVAWLETERAAASAEDTGAEAAASGDLGYTFGRYEIRGTPLERGAYVRVWARDARGRWWLVVDVTEPQS